MTGGDGGGESSSRFRFDEIIFPITFFSFLLSLKIHVSRLNYAQFSHYRIIIQQSKYFIVIIVIIVIFY